MAVSVWVVYSHDCVASQKLGLAATAQHHKRVLKHVSLGWEKIKFQNLKYDFY